MTTKKSKVTTSTGPESPSEPRPSSSQAQEPHTALTEADQTALTRWHEHIVALTEFCDQVEVT